MLINPWVEKSLPLSASPGKPWHSQKTARHLSLAEEYPVKNKKQVIILFFSRVFSAFQMYGVDPQV